MERFPAAFPVTVIVGFLPARLRPAWAACDKIGSRFFVWLFEPDIDIPPIEPDTQNGRETWLWDAFLHEYAHILDWSHLRDKHDQPYAQWHSATWGVWYAKLYQSLTDDP